MEPAVARNEEQLSGAAVLASDLRRLRWTTIVLPVLFLAVLELVRENTGRTFWHSPTGFILTYAAVAAAVTAFAISVFRAIERLESRGARRALQIIALNRLASAAAENLDLHTTVSRGLDEILAATGADAGLVCRVYADEGEHTAIGARGFSTDVAQRIQRAKLSQDPIAMEVVRSGQPVPYRNVFDRSAISAAAAREGIVSGISVPLLSSGHVNGIVAIGYRHDHQLDDDDYLFLRSVGQQLGMSIHNAQLYEASLRQNRDLSALLRVQAVVSSSLVLDEVLSRSLEIVTQLTTAEAGEIWLPDGSGLALHLHGDEAPEGLFRRTRWVREDGLLGRATATGTTTRVTAAEPDFDDGLRAQGFRTSCAVPLRFRSSLVGVMVLAARSETALAEPSERQLIDAIGEQIAPAIENANLHREIQDVSILQERERISREMHDGFGQVLGYVNTQALAVEKFLRDGQLDAAAAELQRLGTAARSLYSDVREGILALRASPAERGLVEALAEYIESYREMFDIDARLEVAPEVEAVRLAPGSEIQLIRIVQQAMSNVRQHAVATRVKTRLSVDGTDLLVEVADDGVGFDPAARSHTYRPRFGLQMMRERALAAGGTFAVESAPGQGTRVIVRFPGR